MSSALPPPSGVARRRTRMADAEMAARMLATARARVNATGLTVSLEHLSFEEIIHDAGVTRSAVYRRWPHKDLFVADLLRELASGTAPSAESNAGMDDLLAEVVRPLRRRLGTEEGRLHLVTELLRIGTAHDVAVMHGSREWRTYLALHATFDGLADGALRDDVGAALAASEAGFVARVAAVHRLVAGMVGYRLRPELHASFELLAQLAGGLIRGLVLMGLPAPAVVQATVRARPLGAAASADWTAAGLGVVALAQLFLEPDPDVEWTPARVRALGTALDDLVQGGWRTAAAG